MSSEHHKSESIRYIREAIDLRETLMAQTFDSEELARLEHRQGWQQRYLRHLESGGEMTVLSDQWAMHHEHVITVRHQPDEHGMLDYDKVLLWCQTCDDTITVHYRAGGEELYGGFDIYEEHVMHSIKIHRDEGPEDRGVAIYGYNIGVDCATCGADRGMDDDFAIFSGVVSDWFDEVWNG